MELKQIYRGHGEWVGVIVCEGKEVYRTGGVHSSAVDALAACASWWEEREKWGSTLPGPDGSFSLGVKVRDAFYAQLREKLGGDSRLGVLFVPGQ